MKELGRSEVPEKPVEGPRRLSHSSANLLQGCNRRYWHKIKGTPFDLDYCDDRQALRVGKGFHTALELANHETSKLTKEVFQKAMKMEGVVSPQERGLILAMAQVYLRLHSRSRLKVVVCEIEIGDKHVIGFVDAVMVDERGNWWIVDLKTAGRLSNDLLSRLENDPQLNLYSYYRADIARALKLDVKKFQGCRYRVTTKVTLKIRSGESYMLYAQRIKDKIESYDIGIPFREKVVENTRQTIEILYDKTEEVRKLEEHEVLQNLSNCFSYFSPCPHWKRCHGDTFSRSSEKLKLVSSKTMKPTLGKTPETKVEMADVDKLLDLL